MFTFSGIILGVMHHCVNHNVYLCVGLALSIFAPDTLGLDIVLIDMA